ncbi:MAG: hypothetical protein ACTHKL_29260 [Streptosporangiaceae bacterium]
MQPNAIIFHGTGADPQTAWYPWLGGRLAERGYAVSIPHYPRMNIEPVATLLPKVLASHGFDEKSVLIGHSGGAAFLLALLEHIDVTVAQAILVAGYCTRPNTEDEPVLQDRYDWDTIKATPATCTSSTRCRIPMAVMQRREGQCSTGWAAPRSS